MSSVAFTKNHNDSPDNKAMLTNQELANRIREAITTGPLSIPAVADAMEVTRPAVDQWMSKGSIDYRKLPMLANLTGVPLQLFIPEAGAPETATLTAVQWRAAILAKKIPRDRLSAFFSTGDALSESAGKSRTVKKSA